MQSVSCSYDEINEQITGLYFSMKKNGKLGLLNIDEGKEISPFIYDEIKKISYTGYLTLKLNDKYAIFDLKNQTYTEPIFEDVRVGKLEIGNYGENLEIKYNGN